MKHLTTKNKENISSHYFSDEIYGQILDSIAVACADTILTCDNKVLLAKRNLEPRSDHWWYTGGRMIAGENPVEAAKRRLFEEAKLDIADISRFKFFNVYSAYYPIRHQAPRENGAHTINITYTVEITPEEKEKFDLTKSEYASSEWIEINKVMEFLEKEGEDLYVKTCLEDFVKYFNNLKNN